VAPLRIVVNADDLGMSAAVDDAVCAGLAAGWLTSTTILANGPTAADALRRVRAFPRASVGVHLNISEFAPLTGGLARLLDRGAFGPGSLSVRASDHDAVAAEWSAQIARVREAGVAVSHLDSHQHLHQLPVLRPVIRDVCARFGISRVRGMGALRPLGTGVRAAAGALRQRLRAERFVATLRRDGLATTDGFASVTVFLAHRARETVPTHWRTVELMAHPGNPHSPSYAEEVAALTEGEPRGLVRASWWDVG
jgi:predicted glycoside hydrolase/deacetylase ChbG (UPF0249 family)